MNSKKIKIAFALTAGSLLITGCGHDEDEINTTTLEKTEKPIEQVIDQNTEDITGGLRDGSYTYKQTFPSGDAESYLDISLQITDGVISSIEVIGDPNGEDASSYSEEFKLNLKDNVIGKNIEDAKHGGYISGASAAVSAFSNALDNIKMQASQ